MRQVKTAKANLLAACALLLPTLASAHDFWIEPSTFHPASGERVSTMLRVGENLHGDPVVRKPNIDRFILKGKGAEVPMTGELGAVPAGSAVVPDAGPHWIGYQSHPTPIELPAEQFESYLREEGLERIIELRAKSGKSADDGRERFYRCAKSLLDGNPRTAVFDVPLGFTVELIPRKNPYALKAGAELPVALLYRSKPVAGALVVAMNGTTAIRARTDANGLVKLRLANPGFWLIKAVHMDAAPPDAGVDWESWWASITFDLAK